MTSDSKPPTYLLVGKAKHFLSWELPHYRNQLDLRADPSRQDHLHAFGPDTIEAAVDLPARSRSALLFPGFGWHPYFDQTHRSRTRKILTDHFDIVFANPGPIAAAFADLPNLHIIPFSVHVDAVPYRTRRSLESLLHASADWPQKDWRRSDVARQWHGTTVR